MTFIEVYLSPDFNNFCKAIAKDGADDLKNEVAIYFYSLPKEKQQFLETQEKLDKYIRVMAWRIKFRPVKEVHMEVYDHTQEDNTLLELAAHKIEIDKCNPKLFFHAKVFERSTLLGTRNYSKKIGVSANTINKLRQEYKQYIKEWIKEKLG